jgi:thymidylate kinase
VECRTHRATPDLAVLIIVAPARGRKRLALATRRGYRSEQQALQQIRRHFGSKAEAFKRY